MPIQAAWQRGECPKWTLYHKTVVRIECYWLSSESLVGGRIVGRPLVTPCSGAPWAVRRLGEALSARYLDPLPRDRRIRPDGLGHGNGSL